MDKVIDGKSFWRTLGERATGITIVTAQGSDGPAGFLGLSASHVCADPPTMLVSIDDKTSALAAVLESKAFAINYLPASARDVADLFAGKGALKGPDRFEAGRWSSLTTGAPVFNDALGAFDCRLEDTVRRGTTTIAIGRVVDLIAKGSGEPLIFFRGQYRND
ncbi:flavin reductase family protein [Microbacteriaceae bacterium K1510]|nr:flavin reductase family protein [Microbacteriaceae bacterium K1510]